MIRLFLSVVLVSFSIFGNGCSLNYGNQRQILTLVDELSWDSVGGNCQGTMLIVFPEGYPATKLIEIGEPATAELLRAMHDKNKGVAAHLILTEIWMPNQKSLSVNYHWTEEDLTGWTYTYNHEIPLSWDYVSGYGDEISSEELKKAEQLWRQSPEVALYLESAYNNRIH